MEEIEYGIIRCRRKTIAIQVKQDGEVVVRAPLRIPEKSIVEFVDLKREWIENAIRKQKEKSLKNDFSFENGGKVKLFGEDYIVCLHDARGVISNDYAYLREDDPKQSFSNIAALYLRKYVGKHLPEIAREYGFDYSGYTITKAEIGRAHV